MIELYTWNTPNGRKPVIMLEEIGLAYAIHPVDLSAEEQFEPSFFEIAPNNKIPAIIDDDGPGGRQRLFESGAILSYLAQRAGQLLPASGPAHWDTLAWLHWQIGGLGPMLGQLGFFGVFAEEKAPLAIERFTNENKRLLGVMERRLADRSYLAGAEYSIADIACYPWVLDARDIMHEPLGETFTASPAINDWLARIGERPAVDRGMRITANLES